MQESLQNLFESFINNKNIFMNKKALSISYAPDNIPHREKEINLVASMLAPSLRLERPSNIFMYGGTGTGKTLVARHVCDNLKKISEKRGIGIKVIYINCKMRKVADTEYRLIAQLAREFGKAVPATGLPTDEVYKIFYNALDEDRSVVIIVLDEIDNLVKKCGDEILYNLTRINQELKNSEVCIVGISNDLTFINNIDSRARSSLSEEEIIFSRYDALHLKDILMERAKLAFIPSAISEEVISKCAAYAAKEHGDARRALDLLRVAGEISERNGGNQITEKHVDEADEKIEKDRVIELIKKQPTQSMIVLHSIISILKSREPPVFTGDVYEVYKGLCVQIGERKLTQRRISDLISELDAFGIINAKVISRGREGRTREISLAIPNNTCSKIESLLKENIGF